MKLLIFVLLVLFTSCSKSVDPPQPEPVKNYRLVLKCVDYKRDTLIVGKFKIARWLCAKTVIDTIKN